MSKTIYTLGQEGARKFKELTSGKTSVSKRIAYSPQHGIDNYYPTPYQVQWAQSSGEKDEYGNYKGTYIIYIPKNCFRNGSSYKYSWNLAFAENYSKMVSTDNGTTIDYGWMDLSPMLSSDPNNTLSEFPDEFEIWMDYSEIANVFYFYDTSLQEISRRILIATVKNKNVIQHINSSIVVNDANKPFNIITWLHEEKPIYRLSYNAFYDNGQWTQIGDYTIPTDISGVYDIALVANDVLDDKNHVISTDYEIKQYEILSTGQIQIDKQPSRLKHLYTCGIVNGVVNVMKDIRDAEVDLLNSTECDDTSITRINDVSKQADNYETLSSSWWYNTLHIYGFHNHGDSTAWDDGDAFIVRGGGKGINPPEGDEHVDYLNITNFRNGILQQVADALSGDLSGIITVDNMTISKGGDGQLSGVLHLNNFYNNTADTTTLANSSILLRTPATSDVYSDAKNKLEYIPFNHFKDWLDDVIDTAITEALDDALSETGDITTAINEALSGLSAEGGSSGMFAWVEATRTIGPGGCMVGRQWYVASNVGSGKVDGLYQLAVEINAGGNVECTVVSDATLGQAPTDRKCWIPIYQISSGKIAIDYRGSFVVPAYD